MLRHADGSYKRGRSAFEHGSRGDKALESSSHLHPPGWHEACALATLSAQRVAQCDGVSDSVRMHPRGVTVTWAGDIQKLSKGMQLCSLSRPSPLHHLSRLPASPLLWHRVFPGPQLTLSSQRPGLPHVLFWPCLDSWSCLLNAIHAWQCP